MKASITKASYCRRWLWLLPVLTGKTAKTDKIDQTGKTDKIGKTAKTDKIGKTAKTDKIDRTGKTDRTDKRLRALRPQVCGFLSRAAATDCACAKF